jgi:hypothetical protein
MGSNATAFAIMGAIVVLWLALPVLAWVLIPALLAMPTTSVDIVVELPRS